MNLTHEFQPVAVQDFSTQAGEERGRWCFFPGFNSIVVRRAHQIGKIVMAQRRTSDTQIELLAKWAAL